MTEAVSNEFNAKGSPAAGAIEAAEAALGFAFPDDYRSFLARFDGGEGFVGEHYLILWAADEIVPFNHDYEIAQYAPGLIAIGSDGGGEAFAYDTRTSPYCVVVAPFIGMSLEDAIEVAPSFAAFISRLKDSPESVIRKP